MSETSNKFKDLGKSLIVPSSVAFVAWFVQSTYNYTIKSKSGMHFSVNSFLKNMLFITGAGAIIEYSRIEKTK